MSEKNSQRSCFLPAIVFGAFGLGLVSFLVVLTVKFMPVIMPKMMAQMMPKMMAYMEEAEVEPPCAVILKRYFEEQRQDMENA